MVYMLLAHGFEEAEALVTVDLLRRAGVETALAAVNELQTEGGHGIRVQADITIDEMDLTDLDMIVLPGGLGGVAPFVGDHAVKLAAVSCGGHHSIIFVGCEGSGQCKLALTLILVVPLVG